MLHRDTFSSCLYSNEATPPVRVQDYDLTVRVYYEQIIYETSVSKYVCPIQGSHTLLEASYRPLVPSSARISVHRADGFAKVRNLAKVQRVRQERGRFLFCPSSAQ